MSKIGLTETFVIDNGTEFIQIENITQCLVTNIKHKTRTSHVTWTNGLFESMNCSQQEFLRCKINGNDLKKTEWSTDEKLFTL